MQEGTFEIGKPGYYTVANAVENEFLNGKLESDQYGIYYSVRFDGDAETYLWQAKTAPEESKAYYGHIEESKSGKSLRFKKDKAPEGPGPSNNSWQESPQKQDSINRAVALNNAVVRAGQDGGIAGEIDVLGIADIYYQWLSGEEINSLKEKKPKARDWENLHKRDIVQSADELFPEEET